MSKATITLPLIDLRAAVDAVLPAVSGDEITPVLTGALFQLSADGNLTVTGTDRYRVHRVRTAYKGSKSGEFLVPRDLLKWTLRNARFFGRRTRDAVATLDFTFEADDRNAGGSATRTPKGRVTITLAADVDTPNATSIAYTLPLINGNFPPVHRLIDEALAAEPTTTSGHARIDMVAEAHKMADYKHQAGIFRVVPSPDSNRPGRLLIEYPRGEVLIQLNEPERVTR